MTEQKIKPCPFGCKGKPSPVVFDKGETYETWHVWCNECDAQGPNEITEEKAIKAWNRRKI